MKMPTLQTLSISQLKPNPQVVHLLPSELAHRYHALPVAIEGERLTVAMAHPEDEIACQELMATLGPIICWVKADEQELDRLISELWPQNFVTKSRIRTWFPVNGFREADHVYARSVCTLLEAELRPYDDTLPPSAFFERILKTSPHSPADLLIFRSPNPPLIKRLLLEPAEQSYIYKIPTSMLVLREPRWPIRKILLVFHDNKSDDTALSWGIRFAKQGHASLTILPLVPSPSGAFANMQARHNIAELLARDYPLGTQLRSAAQQLIEWKIDGKLRLRNEPVDQQLRCEVAEGRYDLIIVGAETQNTISRWVLGQLVNPLLYWADRPLIITKSPTL
jgi:hypothetical protein